VGVACRPRGFPGLPRPLRALQSVLGHGSAAFTLTVYGHVFEADMDSLAESLETVLAVTATGRGRDDTEAEAGRAQLYTV
jgi:hypothetical protein